MATRSTQPSRTSKPQQSSASDDTTVPALNASSDASSKLAQQTKQDNTKPTDLSNVNPKLQSANGSRHASPVRVSPGQSQSGTTSPSMSSKSNVSGPRNTASSSSSPSLKPITSPIAQMNGSTESDAQTTNLDRPARPTRGSGNESPRMRSPTSVSYSRRNSNSSVRLSDTEGTELSGKTTALKNLENNDKSVGSGSQPTSSPAVKILRGPSGLGSKLETVDEGDHSVSPNSSKLAVGPTVNGKKSQGDRPSKSGTEENENGRDMQPTATATQGTKGENAKPNVVPGKLSKPRSNPVLAPKKSNAIDEGSSGHMIVETETVSSIPQANTTNRDSERGSLRMKPSSETIRPKKDRKKGARKPASIVSGSSKADIFEAKVASEIEGESTDSDETFVYESNPPEPRAHSGRYHSRTPSATSVHSLAERRIGGRPMGHLLDGQKPPKSRRSMKFASNSYASSSMEDDGSENVRNTSTSNRPQQSPRHESNYRHFGRRQIDATGSDSGNDHESPFSKASKLRVATGSGPKTSLKSASPATTPQQPFITKKFHNVMMDREDEDDERAPLIGSLRSPKTRVKRPSRHLRRLEDVYEPPRRDCWRRCAGLILIALALVLILLFGAGFLFLSSKPLYGVQVRDIRNVLASKQEIIMDLVVEATNPNLATITIDYVNLDIFAKSSHVVDDGDEDSIAGGAWSSMQTPRQRRRPSSHRSHVNDLHPDRFPPFWDDHPSHGGVDEGNDPIDDPEHDAQTMLLGRVLEFESALVFDASPFRRLPQDSMGELRLERPGNRTETKGSARWEIVAQHPFELIVRGTLKYQLPLSTHTLSKSIGARVLVNPNEGVDDAGRMHVIPIGALPPADNERANETSLPSKNDDATI